MKAFQTFAIAAFAVAFAAPTMAQERLSEEVLADAKKVETEARDRLAEVIAILKDRPAVDKEFQKKIDVFQDAKEALEKTLRNGGRVTVAQKTAPDNATETLRNERAKIPFNALEKARDALLTVKDLRGLNKATHDRLIEGAEALSVYLERAITLRNKASVQEVESKEFKAEVDAAVKALESLQASQGVAPQQDQIAAKVKSLREELAKKETELLRKGKILVELAQLEAILKDRRTADELVASIEKEPSIVEAAKTAEEKYKAVKALQ